MFKRRIKELIQALILSFAIGIIIEHFYINPNRVEFNEWMVNMGINFFHIFLIWWIIFWFIFIKRDSKSINKKDEE